MSETQVKFQQPEGERLYRYHPETGFTEVSPTQIPNTDMPKADMPTAQAEQSAPFGQNPSYFTQASPYGQNPAFGAPTATPTSVTAQAQAVPPMGMPFGVAMGMPPQALAYHEAHMLQMQEYANAQMAQASQAAQAAHAAQMAFMAQNAAMLGFAPNANSAKDADESAEAKSTEFSKERMQAMYQTVSDVVNGKAEPTKVLGLFEGISTDFWKGAALGAAAIALYNYTPLKDVIHTSLGTLLATTGLNAKNAQAEDSACEDDLDEDGFYKETPTEENK